CRASRATAGLVMARLHRIRLPLEDRLAWQSHTCLKPSFPDRSAGSAHCKMSLQDALGLPTSGKSDISSYRDLSRRRADLNQSGRAETLPLRPPLMRSHVMVLILFRSRQQRTDEVVI